MTKSDVIRGLDRGRRIGALVRLIVGAVLPAQCMACRRPVDQPGRLCSTCWAGVRFIAPPQCTICGLPFDYGHGADALCGACTARPPPYARARAVMRYGDVAAALAVGLKYSDRLHFVPSLGAWLLRAGAPLLGDCDAIVPVPLHRFRLLSRRFNQSALLAKSIGRLSGVPVIVDGLTRRRATPPQTGLPRARRLRNVRGAFAVTPKRASQIGGKAVLLVDDVMTTGATVDACAKALLRGGARQVDVLTLARVVASD